MSSPHLPLRALLLLVPPPSESGVEERPLPCPPTSETSPSPLPLTSSLIWLQNTRAPVCPLAHNFQLESGPG